MNLELVDSGIVWVAWQPPTVPVGVTLQQYKVYYHNSTALHDIVLSSGPTVMVRGLELDQLYRFEVVAEYLEVDGEVYEGTSASDEVEIFVPGESRRVKQVQWYSTFRPI